ncbi:hypothetical protein ASPVEDRAFT_590544 [Aspergillus versicolor CBS 583.65]|uniref:Uncharacterized protein n=1 Tax=Aspergillus versicolor CBS 583.65 TaxID=1036611 RepID=A0A1L9PH15_ASPVE|nr:uncharacterized protein ASPVEDRAFT_590544 [Aspergillus versicolor CBS 583.65]OJJ00809.1 hypothetical protein ASPVEDRAFT_590544 [Aspergillus versicolor CBS 583.65]
MSCCIVLTADARWPALKIRDWANQQRCISSAEEETYLTCLNLLLISHGRSFSYSRLFYFLGLFFVAVVEMPTIPVLSLCITIYILTHKEHYNKSPKKYLTVQPYKHITI